MTFTFRGLSDVQLKEKTQDENGRWNRTVHATLKRGADAEFQFDLRALLVMLFLFRDNGTEKLGSVSTNDEALKGLDRTRFTFGELRRAAESALGAQAFEDADLAVVIWSISDLRVTLYIRITN